MIAITAFFAPPEQEVRKMNFLQFRRNLGIPLIVVEFSKGGFFHIQPSDCEYLVRLTNGDALWQKEAMLNVGIRKARELGYDKACLLDADIVFSDRAWHRKVCDALDSHDLVQCFSDVHYLSKLCTQEAAGQTELSAARAMYRVPSLSKTFDVSDRRLFRNSTDDASFSYPGTILRGNPGLAWGVNLGRSDFFLYEKNIVGAGDLVLFSCLKGRLGELFKVREFSMSHRRDIVSWADLTIRPVMKSSFVACDLFHLWHGDENARGYNSRYAVLADNAFDPGSDTRSSSDGLIEFTGRNPGLETAVQDYMRSRSMG